MLLAEAHPFNSSSWRRSSMKVGSKVSLHPVDPGRGRTWRTVATRVHRPRLSPCHDPAIHRLARGPCLPREVTSQILGPTVQPHRRPLCSVILGSDFKTLTLSTEALPRMFAHFGAAEVWGPRFNYGRCQSCLQGNIFTLMRPNRALPGQRQPPQEPSGRVIVQLVRLLTESAR